MTLAPMFLAQVKTIWSYIFRNFEIEAVSPLPEPSYEALVVGPKPPCLVRYRRRAGKADRTVAGCGVEGPLC